MSRRLLPLMVAIGFGRVHGTADRSKFLAPLDEDGSVRRVTVQVDELFALGLAHKGPPEPESGTYMVLLTDAGRDELTRYGGTR